MKRNPLLILCALAVMAVTVFLTGCATAESEAFEINAVSAHGKVCVAGKANAGDKVKFEVTPDDGYVVDKVYLNGKAVSGSDFVMPDGEARLLATYAQSGGHAVNCDNDNDDGVTFADLSTAVKGSSVTLYTYSAYGKKATAYFVNGTKILGNKFTMPDYDVTVATEYEDVFDGTELTFGVSQSATAATSHWRVSYENDGLLFDIKVEDSVVYSVTTFQKDEAYLDNVEFVLGFADRNGTSWGLDNYKIIIVANGAYRFQRYNGSGWINYASSVTCEVADKKLFDDGYAGYSAQMFIPYTALGTTYQKALDNVTIAVAMRNTVNPLNTSWGFCSLNGCLWNSPQTHFLVTRDGFVLDNKPEYADCLFAGNGLFDLNNWTSFASSAKKLGDCASVAEEGASIKYWTDNVEQITSIKTQKIIFGGGAEDIAEAGVLQAFARMTELVAALKADGRSVLLVSQIPSCNVDADNEAVAAYNEMLRDYAEQTDNVDYLDVVSAFYKQKAVYKSLYKSTNTLSEDGYRMLSKLLLKKFGKYVEQGNAWGDNGSFVATSIWAEEGNEVSLYDGGIQETFLRGQTATDFEFTATMTANQVLGGDAWPKMGLTMHGTDGNYYFYIDATGTLDSLVVGLVSKVNDVYLWSDVAKGSMTEGTTYARGSYVTMTVRKVGNAVRCSINGQTVIETDVNLGEQPCVVGLFCFNMQVNVRSWSFRDLTVA